MNLLKYARILKLCSYIKIGLFKMNKINKLKWSGKILVAMGGIEPPTSAL